MCERVITTVVYNYTPIVYVSITAGVETMDLYCYACPRLPRSLIVKITIGRRLKYIADLLIEFERHFLPVVTPFYFLALKNLSTGDPQENTNYKQ